MSLIPSVNQYLQDLNYPATKDEIINYAKEHEAPDEVINVLNKLPKHRFYGQTDLLRSIIS